MNIREIFPEMCYWQKNRVDLVVKLPKKINWNLVIIDQFTQPLTGLNMLLTDLKTDELFLGFAWPELKKATQPIVKIFDSKEKQYDPLQTILDNMNQYQRLIEQLNISMVDSIYYKTKAILACIIILIHKKMEIDK